MENQIKVYFHCKKCIEEMPEGISPAEWSRVNVGRTKDGGIQIWCMRHNVNIALIDNQELQLLMSFMGAECAHPSHKMH